MKKQKNLIKELQLDLNIDSETFKPKVWVKIYFSPNKKNLPFEFSLSHYVRTPTQAEVYIPNKEWETEVDVMYYAKRAIEYYINGAIGIGYKPSDDWLVKNNFY